VSHHDFLPYCRHLVEEDDIAAVTAVLRGPWLTGGPAVAGFESDLAAAVGAPYAVACANGTAALHLTALALGLGPGDAILVPAQTFAATANCGRFVGAEVVFTDVCPDSGLMRPQDLEAALAANQHRRLKAVYPVHLNGQPADMPALSAIARREGLVVVEDAAHALGSIGDGGAPVGNCQFADMTIFSFHPAKTIAMGEGGAVTTRSEALDRSLRDLRAHGIVRDPQRLTEMALGFDGEGQPNPWYYEMQSLGFNYRASDINCALGRSQLAKLSRFSTLRQTVMTAYDQALAGLAGVTPIRRRPNVRPVWHLYAVHIDFAAVGRSRGQVMRDLAALGIGTQVNYIPVHWLPYYRQIQPDLSLPGAEAYYSRCLSLPFSAAMGAEDVQRVAAALRQVLGM